MGADRLGVDPDHGGVRLGDLVDEPGRKASIADVATPPHAPEDGTGSIRAALSHSFAVLTGQHASPRMVAIVVPWPSWSVLLRQAITRRPSSVNSRSSSDRRIAPAEASSSKAQSRNPLGSSAAARETLCMDSLSSGVFAALGAVPIVL